MSSLFELCATLSMDTGAFDTAVAQALRQGERLSTTLRQQTQQAAQGLTAAASGASAAWQGLGSVGSASMAQLRASAVGAWQAITGQIQAATAAARGFFSVRGGTATGAGFATGLDYVPYDNFTARLHEGEAVLTKLEADNWRQGGPSTAAAAVDASAIGAAVRDALAGVTVALDGQRVGELVAPEVSARMGREARGRRFAG